MSTIQSEFVISEYKGTIRKCFLGGCLCLLFLCLIKMGNAQTPNAPATSSAASIAWDFIKVIVGALALGVAGVIGAYLTRWKERIEKKKIAERANAAEETARQAQGKVQEIEKQSATEKEKTKRFAKEAEDELTKKTEEAQTPPPTEWTKFFKKEVKASARIAQELAGPSKVIVVASGKGGVGKSTVSLGLLEYYNRFGSTLLVDFDMPNRGLTSLLRSKDDDPDLTNTLSELTRFADMPKFRAMFPDSQIAKGGRTLASSVDHPSPAATDEPKEALPD